MLQSYTFDPQTSRFTAQAFASGMLSILAHSPTFAARVFDGTLELSTADAGEAPTVRVAITVKAQSLELIDDLKAKDRQEIQTVINEQVLETASFPEIRYETATVTAEKISAASYRAHLTGKLTLHGVTREQAVDVQISSLGDSIRVGGSAMVSQAAHDIKRVKAAGGMIQAKDEVKIAFDLVGRKKEGSV